MLVVIPWDQDGIVPRYAVILGSDSDFPLVAMIDDLREGELCADKMIELVKSTASKPGRH